MDLKSMIISPEDEEYIESAIKKLRQHYKNYRDPWGFNLDIAKKALYLFLPFYRNYFRVRVFNPENIPEENIIVVSNHSGQIPIDGLLISIAFFLEAKEPKILRAMVERFMVQLPFIADLSAQSGAILGDRANCHYLLENGESILVFPEGVKGISKNTKDYYKLQPFSQGFYRIALQKQKAILPAAVVGAEDMYPYVYHLKSLAKKLSLPSFPLSPNLWPLPSPIDIYIGEPVSPMANLSSDAPDKDINEPIYEIEEKIKSMIQEGLKNKRPLTNLNENINPIKFFEQIKAFMS